MEFVFQIIAYPFFSLLAAVVGILWPTEDPAVRRLQRICLGMLAAGVAILAIAIIGAFWWAASRTLMLLVVAGLVFVAAGQIGGRIERLCLSAKPDESPSRSRCQVE